MNEWMSAGIAVAAALVIGAVARSVASRLLSAEQRPEPLRASADALSGFVFSTVLIIGLVVALGFVDPDSLEELPADIVAFVPKVIAAAVLLIGANIAAAFGGVAINRSLAGVAPASRQRAVGALRAVCLGAGALLAAGQLGVNTTVLNLAAAAALFGLAATFALLSGLGGRRVSSELAAGRVVRRMVSEGDHVRVGELGGIVSRIHPATLELEQADGSLALVPHSRLLDADTTIRRATP